jgi:NADH-quinone oxidoreductase subunit N
MTTFLAILPESILLLLAVLLLCIDPFLKKQQSQRAFLGWYTGGGLLLAAILTAIFARPADPVLVFGSMLRYDWLGYIFKLVVLVAAGITAFFFMESETVQSRGESYVLLLASSIGMCLMVTSADLIVLYLAIETTSIPLYVLAGFLKADDRSNEAGFKYLLYGALTSAVLLYGFSLIYGFSGTTSIYQMTGFFASVNLAVLGIAFLVLAGLAFKIALFPFHFWAPDVYEGAPTPVAGFLSTASKVAGFAVLLRLLTAAFPAISQDWSLILAILATLTMTVGNLIALTQKSVKRLLAYSSIAHAGYVLIGVVAFTRLGVISVIYYLMAYVLTNLTAFGILAIVGRVTGSDEIGAYNGLSRRNPGLALAALAAFLSLAGMPPFAGFVAKVFVFTAAIEAGWVWLAVVGVLNSIFGLYYYLNVLKAIYLYRMENQDEDQHPVPVSRPLAVLVGILAGGMILFGVVLAPWFSMAGNAASALLTSF